MAAPHVTGAVALVSDTAAGLRLPMSVTRFLIMESARHDLPRDEADRLRYGAAASTRPPRAAWRKRCAARRQRHTRRRCSAQDGSQSGFWPRPGRPATGTGAVALAGEPATGMDVVAVAGEPTPGLSSLPFVWDGESAVGQLQVATTTVDLEPEDPAEHRDAIDDATFAALRRPGHALVQAASSGGFDISDFGPPRCRPRPSRRSQPTRPCGRWQQTLGHACMCADQDGPGNRWVHVPGLSELLCLPAADWSRHVDAWASQAARSSAGLLPSRCAISGCRRCGPCSPRMPIAPFR